MKANKIGPVFFSFSVAGRTSPNFSPQKHKPLSFVHGGPYIRACVVGVGSLGAGDRRKETPGAEPKPEVVFLLRDLSKSVHETAARQWGRFPHLSLWLRYKTQGLLCCSGTDVQGEVMFLWHMLYETFPAPAPPFLKKTHLILVSVPKKRQQYCWNYCLTSEIKRQNILGCV